MDVHTTNYTLCCYSMEDDRFFAEVQVEPDVKNILKYLARIEKQQNKECRIYLTWVLQTAPTLDRTLEGRAVPLLPANAPEFCTTT